MKQLISNIKGDKTVWAITAVLAIFSFLPVYSASTNLVYVAGKGTTLGYLVKHAILILLGFIIVYTVHKIPYKYFSGLSVLLMPVVIVLLIFTLAQGTVIGGANASRWIQIPFMGVGFQTSTLAVVVLMMFVSRYLARNKEKEVNFKESLLYLWLPVAVVLVLILPANLSTTAMSFFMVMILTYLGGYPVKYLMYILGMGAVVLLLFVLLAKAFPDIIENTRVATWNNRIENYLSGDKEDNYQLEKAKIAIASGEINGKGPGKSTQKNFLPQSSSDFIYAIIAEEFGLIGAILVIILYIGLLFRIVIITTKSDTIFGTLLTLGVGLPIIFQALVNIGVAVGIFPVTGQPLPLISTGGTSIWMTCFAIGVILSVSAASTKKAEEKARKEDFDNPLDILHEAVG
ncbi:MAG: cell division protein FtsW [Flavobacteriia bacterium]|nr:MAG: cell division protein FtsW [Flavobacteriia bacterium]